MYIKHIRIENFRSIRLFDSDFSPNANILFGVNGSGKTSVLYALGILFSWFTARLNNAKGNGTVLRDEDIHHGEKDCLLEVTLDNDITWSLYRQHSRYRSAPRTKTNLKALSEWVNGLVERAHQEEDFPIPLFHCFSAHRRTVGTVPKRFFRRNALGKFDIYTDKADSNLTPNAFFSWYREREDIENEQYRWGANFRPDHQLKAHREATARNATGYHSLRIERPHGLVIEREGKKYLFEQLSDGEKAYYMLVADIARLLAMSHPNIDEDPLKAGAIILIDEVDLHLHPQWQREVLPQLRDIFPNCQFVVTTHSPYVLSSADSDSALFTIEQNEIKQANSVYGAEVSSILLGSLGLTSLRAKAVQRDLDIVWGCLAKGDDSSPQFNEALARLEEVLGFDTAELGRINLQKRVIEKKRK